MGFTDPDALALAGQGLPLLPKSLIATAVMTPPSLNKLRLEKRSQTPAIALHAAFTYRPNGAQHLHHFHET